MTIFSKLSVCITQKVPNIRRYYSILVLFHIKPWWCNFIRIYWFLWLGAYYWFTCKNEKTKQENVQSFHKNINHKFGKYIKCTTLYLQHNVLMQVIKFWIFIKVENNSVYGWKSNFNFGWISVLPYISS